MPSTYEHKALIEQLRNLSAEKTASENPSEEAINTSHPSGDSSVDDDGTTPATTGERYAENTSDDKAMNPSGTESAPTNSPANYSDAANPGVDADTDTSATSGSPDDPIANDPGTAHPVGKEATDALLKEASEIGAALQQLIKAACDDSDDDMDYAEESAEESSDEESSDDSDGEDAAKESASKLRKMSSEIHQIEATLKEAADRDADAFATVLFGVLKQSMPMPLASEEEAVEEAPAEEEAEEVLAQMAMADAAPSEEEAVEEEAVEEAPAEEEILEAIAPDAVAEEEAPAEEALSPEEEMMLMQLLGSEGMAPEDVEAYGKMSALLETGQIKGDSMSKAQRDYFTSCHQAAKTAQARFDTWKSSAALSNELNGIYQRGAK